MKKISIISFLMLVTLISCEPEPKNIEAVSNIYGGCCGTKPMEYSNQNVNIYVPNVFTPNGDGINDMFYPIVNEGVTAIQSFTIKSAVGDTVLFYRAGIDLKDPTKMAWDGINYSSNNFGKLHDGKFKYGMGVLMKGIGGTVIEGEGCVIRCSKSSKIFETKEGCFFGSQAGTNGNLDKLKTESEKVCF